MIVNQLPEIKTERYYPIGNHTRATISQRKKQLAASIICHYSTRCIQSPSFHTHSNSNEIANLSTGPNKATRTHFPGGKMSERGNGSQRTGEEAGAG